MPILRRKVVSFHHSKPPASRFHGKQNVPIGIKTKLQSLLRPHPATRGGTPMLCNRWCFSCLLMIATVVASLWAQAGDLKINIPRSGKLTPVQRLNREGVEAVRKHNYSKAERLFYKAYLFDPDDSFTLNNLGYIAEIQGELDRAEQFYGLARQQSSDAVVDIASAQRMKGQPMKE